MKTCQQYENLLTEKLFGELEAHRAHELEQHLAECAACRATLAELQSVLQAVGKPARPHMPEHFWEGYWDRLRVRMEREPQAGATLWERLRARFALRWHPALRLAAAAALVLLGIVIGRNFRTPAEQTVAVQTVEPNQSAQVEAIDLRTSQLLERSKILLLGVVNEDFTAASTGDLVQQRKYSRELLTEVRSLQTVLPNSPDRRLLQLVEQLELVLMQIAALEIDQDLQNVELVREGINREGLLLKINIEELQRRAKAETPSSAPPKSYL